VSDADNGNDGDDYVTTQVFACRLPVPRCVLLHGPRWDAGLDKMITLETMALVGDGGVGDGEGGEGGLSTGWLEEDPCGWQLTLFGAHHDAGASAEGSGAKGVGQIMNDHG